MYKYCITKIQIKKCLQNNFIINDCVLAEHENEKWPHMYSAYNPSDLGIEIVTTSSTG